MAAYNNITLLPGSGSGDAELSITATDNWGRETRSAVFTAENTELDIKSDNSLIVTQAGYGPFIDINSIGSIGSAGGEVEMSGYSNYDILTFDDVDGNESLLDCLSSAEINEGSVTSSQLRAGFEPDGDPGATGRYPVFLVFDIPANAGSTQKTYSFVVNDETFSFTQQGGAEPVGTEIWFSDGDTDPSGIPIEIRLNANGGVRSGVTDTLYINTDPGGESWTIL